MTAPGFLARLRTGLARTTQQIVQRFEAIAGAGAREAPAGALEGETLEALEEILISADVGVSASDRIVSRVRAGPRQGGRVRDLVKDEILAIFASVPATSRADGPRPRVVLVVGVNGTGKTTTVGKLAHLLRTQGERVLICAADTYRAAAVEQLEVWAARAGVDIVRAREGADPASVVFDAVQSATAKGLDTVLVDTAGRLHTRVNLMSELEKIRRVASRAIEGAPHEVLLVLDATVGQNGLAQAREFASAAGVTGIVLTKLDGTAKGGIAVAIAHDLGLPIRYVGVGEGMEDLVPFSAAEYVETLFQDTW